MSTLTARSPRRVAARDVRHADGSRSLLPAVDLVRASAVVACRGVAEPHTFLDGVGERNGATTRSRHLKAA
jgi:hypothetical protein